LIRVLVKIYQFLPCDCKCIAWSAIEIRLSVCLSRAVRVKRKKNFCSHFYIIWKIDHLSFPTRKKTKQ